MEFDLCSRCKFTFLALTLLLSDCSERGQSLNGCSLVTCSNCLLPGDERISIEIYAKGCQPWSVTAKTNLIFTPVSSGHGRPAQLCIARKARISHVFDIGYCDNCFRP